MATGATGAKFHLQCINISRDILDFVICLHTVATYDVITFFNLNISRMREDITKKKTPFFFILKGLSNKLNLFERPKLILRHHRKYRLDFHRSLPTLGSRAGSFPRTAASYRT